jgi:hypothetical protein
MRGDARVMFLVALLLAPSVMVAASFAERRLGPAAAGWLNAAPLSIAVAVLVVSADRGVSAGLTIATTAAAHVPAQVAFAVTFATALHARATPTRGLLAGTAAFTTLAVALAAIPLPVAMAAAIPALLAGPRLLPPAIAAGSTLLAGPARGGGVVVRAVVALGVVGAVLGAVRLAGPELGGTVAAFPALSGCLALLIGRDRGPVAAAHALRGVVHGLAGYLAFCLTLAALGPVLGLPTALVLGFSACLVAFRVTWHAVRLPRRLAVA